MNNNKGQSWGFTGECPKDFKNSEENVTVHTAELYLIPNKKIWYAIGDGQKKTLLISNVWGTVRKVIDSNIDLNIVSDFKCMMIFNDYE